MKRPMIAVVVMLAAALVGAAILRAGGGKGRPADDRARPGAVAELAAMIDAGKAGDRAESAPSAEAEQRRSSLLDRLLVAIPEQDPAMGVDEDIPEPEGRLPLAAGGRVVLVDALDGEDPERAVILCASLEDLRWMHGGLRPEDMPELRRRAAGGMLSRVQFGAIARVVGVAEGELPLGMRAVEVSLGGPRTAWVADTFVR